MEKNTIIGMVVAMIVVIAGISVITIPMISELSDEIHSTEINTGARYSLAETNEKVEIKLVNGIGYINDETIKDDFGYSMLMFSDDFIIMYDVSKEPSATIRIYTSAGVGSDITSIVAEKGNWTGTKADNSTITGTYDFLMAWNKNGNYGAIGNSQITTPLYVNADSKIYVAAASGASAVYIAGGTINNLENILLVGEQPTNTITYEQYTDKPQVNKITAFNCSVVPAAIFVPLKYDTFTSFDQILKTMIDMAPVLIGLMFLAAVGLYMTRNLRM